MIWAGAEVGHHHESPHARPRGGVDHPDRRVAVDGIGPLRVTAARARGEDHRVVPGQQFGQGGRVEPLDVGDDGLGTGVRDLVGMVGVAEHRTDLVTALGEDACEWQRHLAVPADDDDACHAKTLPRAG